MMHNINIDYLKALRKALYDQSQEHNRYTLTHCQLNSTPLYQANNR